MISLYTCKKALLWPRTAIRRRSEKGLDRVGRSMLEVQYYRGPMYDFIAAAVAKPDLLVDVDIDRRSVVLDVGAYDGEWSEKISRRYGSKIYAFEPDPTSLRRLEERVGRHGNVAIFGYGLAGRDRLATLALDGPGSAVADRPG
ncbi:MAG: FkbM family methyltransferase, partial [Acidimicrobiia bacterium]